MRSKLVVNILTTNLAHNVPLYMAIDSPTHVSHAALTFTF
jgi:hypothetical protein